MRCKCKRKPSIKRRPAPEKAIFVKFKILATLLFQRVTLSTLTLTSTAVLKILVRVNKAPFLKSKIATILLLHASKTPSNLILVSPMFLKFRLPANKALVFRALTSTMTHTVLHYVTKASLKKLKTPAIFLLRSVIPSTLILISTTVLKAYRRVTKASPTCTVNRIMATKSLLSATKALSTPTHHRTMATKAHLPVTKTPSTKRNTSITHLLQAVKIPSTPMFNRTTTPIFKLHVSSTATKIFKLLLAPSSTTTNSFILHISNTVTTILKLRILHVPVLRETIAIILHTPSTATTILKLLILHILITPTMVIKFLLRILSTTITISGSLLPVPRATTTIKFLLHVPNTAMTLLKVLHVHSSTTVALRILIHIPNAMWTKEKAGSVAWSVQSTARATLKTSILETILCHLICRISTLRRQTTCLITSSMRTTITLAPRKIGTRTNVGRRICQKKRTEPTKTQREDLALTK